MHLKLQEEQSYVQWVKHGNQNTTFFFRMMKWNHARANILSITNEKEEVVTHPDRIQKVFLDHFQKLLGSSTPTVIEVNFFVSQLIMSRITQIQGDQLGKEKKAMLSLKDGKAPGLDGFSAGFFKKAQCIVDNGVVRVISSPFKGFMHSEAA